MAKRRPKDIGTAAESAVVKYLRANGFPNARRNALAGRGDVGDVEVCPGVMIEVKAGQRARVASDNVIVEWLAETEKERVNAGADVGLLVTVRAGVGTNNAGRWWAIMPMDQFVALASHNASERIHLGRAPVRVSLDTLLFLLLQAGYPEGTDTK